MKNLFYILLLLFYQSICKAQPWVEVCSATDSLNSGLSIPSIRVDNKGNVYASISYAVAKWDGTIWSILGGTSTLSFNNVVSTIAVDKYENVYAGGNFTNSNGKYYVSKWDGISWNELGTGSNALNANGTILCITSDDNGNVFAGGFFSHLNYKHYIVKWDGSKWIELGMGSNGLNSTYQPVSIVTDNNGGVYTSGDSISTDNPYAYNYIAKWDGMSWKQVGIGTNSLNANSNINSIIVDSHNNIYAAGRFYNPSVIYYPYVAKWTATGWIELGTGSNALNPNGDIKSITIDSSGNVYAAGNFTNSNGKYYVAKWDGTVWSELGSGSDALNANGKINSIATDNAGNIYAAGSFTNSNGNYYVAKWGDNPIITSTKEQENNTNLSIYPNPANNQVNMNLSEDGQIKIYSFSGELVAMKDLNTGTSSLDISYLSSGMYTLLFNGQNNIYAPVKFIKE